MLTETDFYKAVIMGTNKTMFMVGRNVFECNVCKPSKNVFCCDKHRPQFVAEYYEVGNYKISKDCYKTDNSLCFHIINQITPKGIKRCIDGHKIYRLLEKSGLYHEHFDQYKTYEGWNELTEEEKEERVAQEEEQMKQKRLEEELEYEKKIKEHTAEKRLAKLKEKNNITKSTTTSNI